MIVGHFDINDLQHKQKLLWWHKAGLQYTASGYGGKIPSTWMVRLPGDKIWRRVYVAQYGNAGTAYVEVKVHGQKKPGWITISGTPRSKR